MLASNNRDFMDCNFTYLPLPADLKNTIRIALERQHVNNSKFAEIWGSVHELNEKINSTDFYYALENQAKAKSLPLADFINQTYDLLEQGAADVVQIVEPRLYRNKGVQAKKIDKGCNNTGR